MELFGSIGWMLWVTLVALFGGCASQVGPPDRAAQVEAMVQGIPDQWPHSTSSPARVTTTASTDPLPWWQSWAPKPLRQLIETALRSNADLSQARAQWDKARALRAQAASALRPTLALTGSAQRGNTSGDRGDTGSAVTLGLGGSWDLDVWGGIAASVEAAQAEESATAWALASQTQSVAAEVAVSYLQWLGVQDRLTVARANLKVQEDTAQIASWRLQAGLASDLDCELAQSAAAQTRAQIPVLETAAALLAQAMAVWVGHFSVDLEPQPWAALVPMNFSWDLPAAVLRRRPDIRSAEAQLEAAAARVTQTEAAALPPVALRMSSIWSAHRLATLGQAAAVSDLVAQVSATLWDGGGRRAAVDAQKASMEIAAQTLRRQLLVAMQSIESAWSASTQAHTRWMAWSQAQASAESAAGLAAERYRGGVADFMAVLEAQRTVLNVQDAAVVARADWWVQQVRLAHALGGEWGRPL